MSFVEKRFCFTCKLDTEQLKKKNKKLKTCSFCQIAQYCGQECQLMDFKLTHKLLCIKVGIYSICRFKSQSHSVRNGRIVPSHDENIVLIMVFYVLFRQLSKEL